MAEAIKVEKSLNLQAERELIRKEGESSLWENLIEEYELAVRGDDIFVRKITKGTLREYVQLLRTYTKDWLKLRVEEIDRARAWIALERIEREVSHSRSRKVRSAIDSLYNWGILSGRIQGASGIPTQGYKSLRKSDEKMPEILNLDEIRNLLKFSRDLNHEWYPVWAMALFTGMRSGELYALEWASVDFENKMIYVHKAWTSKTGFGPTKGRYWRAVPLSDELVAFMKQLKLQSGDSKYVLPRFNAWKEGRQAEILRQFCIGVGLPSVRFHTLRACFGTQLIKDGISPAIVMKVCGWKDLKTMQRYIRLAGIEVKGATDGLKILPEVEVVGRVVNLFGNR